ncbi:MAG: hypothetical protein ACKV2U_23865 [Bryobacteraceae bacterium]
MRKTLLMTAIMAVALAAQAPRVVEEKQFQVIGDQGLHGPTAGAFTFMNAETSFEANVVKGSPFSGDFVTEHAQTLADGNRIRSSNTTSYARDGEGRTRREITFDAMAGAPAKTVFIHDPVSKIDYILDPQAKTARKMMISGNAGPDVVFNHRIEGPKHEVMAYPASGPVTMERMPLPPGIVMHGQAGAVISHKIHGAEGSAGTAGTADFKNEPLGKRMVEGVEAEGTRTTLTIPAGQIGNDRALETVSERWYSNELKTVVMTTRKDPRTGESTYRLANLRRGEPARHLFELPADYKVITEDIIGPKAIRLRVDKVDKKEE